MQTIIVDMTPGFRMPTIYYSQGDVGTQFAIDLRSRFGDTLPESATVTIQATKPSGFGFSVTATSVTNGVALFTTTEGMTDEFGRFPAELKVTKTGLTLFTANFYMDGERNTHPEGTTDGSQETVIPELTQLVERVEAAASSVLDMTVNASTLSAGSQATYSYDEETNTATFGIPQGEAGAGAAGVTASAYSSSRTYAVGDYVIHNSNLYRCTTAITTAEAFTAAHWTQVVLADDVSDVKSDYKSKNANAITRIREALNLDTNQVLTGTLRQIFGMCGRVVPSNTGVLSPNADWISCFDMFSAPNGTSIKINMNGYGAQYSIVEAKYNSDGTLNMRAFHSNASTLSFTIVNGQTYRFGITKVGSRITDNEADICTVTVTEPENKLYQFYQETEENNAAVSQIASVPDNIRAINMFEGSQYDTNTPITGFTVKKKYYSGLAFEGSLAVGAACSVTKQHFDFDSSKTYSVYVQSKQNKRQITFGIRYVVDGETYTLKKSDGTDVAINLCNKAYSFVPYASVENAYFSIFCTSLGADPCMFNDDEYYFYVVEGAYSTEDFEVSNFFASRYEQKQITENLSVGLPILRIYGDITEMTKENSVTLDYIYGSASGSCTMKWQGGSSLLYEKKNYTIKFDNKIDVGWGEQKKYCLKANYIDCTHSMNICAANLWAEIVEDRGTNPAIDVGANCGAVDGFPIIILLNDHFHGLYTMNIPKDPWCFGMGDSLTEYIVNAEIQGNPTYFKSAGALLDGTDFELEYKPDDVSEETVRTALNNMLSAVVSATGSGWEASVDPYIDVDAAIDYMIFSALVQNSDGFGKNYILTTYDGVKWWYNAYDMDTVFGNHWTGGNYYPITQERTSFAGQNDLIRLHHLIYRYSKDALIARYKELRSGILSEAHVYDTFYNFAAVIPQAIRLEDQKAYPTIPATFTQTLERIMTNYRLRCEFMDAEVAALE